MKKYTKKIHAQRVMRMISNKKKPCGYCPAQKRYGKANALGNPMEMWSEEVFPCKVCGDFVGVKKKNLHNSECPCRALGEKEAIERTWLALEEGGYLE